MAVRIWNARQCQCRPNSAYLQPSPSQMALEKISPPLEIEAREEATVTPQWKDNQWKMKRVEVVHKSELLQNSTAEI